MKRYLLAAIPIIICALNASSQGCMATRSTGTSFFIAPPANDRPSYSPPSTSNRINITYGRQAKYGQSAKNDSWTFTANNRYYKSFRHFSGTEEQKQRVEEGTEVINRGYTLDLSLTKIFNNRFSLNVGMPLNANGRSSLYEHGRTERHSTHSFGLGDARVTAYSWLLKPTRNKKGNIQAGLGLKLPTGDYKVQDYFYNTGANGTRLLGPVDQSIQLGDGGTGIITELNSYYNPSRKVGLYANLYYLSNPREQNGVSTARGAVASASAIAYGSDVMSVPDQYMARAGTNIRLRKFTASAGLRIDGVPAEDILGASGGFRRPGYFVSAEPGLTYRISKLNIFAVVPVAIARNRIQSVPDRIRTQLTNTYYKGDAAFADYNVNVGLSYNFK